MLEQAEAGTFSRLNGRKLVRIGDREVAGFFHQDTKRVLLALPGRYKAFTINPLQARDPATLQNVDSLNAFCIGPVTYQKLEPGQSCVVKQPNGSFAIENESFVSVCLGAPMHVGTVFRRTGMTAAGALQGARVTRLQAGGSFAAQFVELAPGHKAIYWRAQQPPIQTGAEASFHLPHDATMRVIKNTGAQNSVSVRGVTVIDGTLPFHGSYNGHIVDAQTFMALPYADIEQLVQAEAKRLLIKQLAGFTRAELFEGSQIGEATDTSKAARKALATARSSIASACQAGGVALEDFVLRPRFETHLANVAADIGLAHANTLKERVTQPMLVEAHHYALASASRAGELGAVQAKNQALREEILGNTPASRRANKMADKTTAVPAWARGIDLTQLQAAMTRTDIS